MVGIAEALAPKVSLTSRT